VLEHFSIWVSEYGFNNDSSDGVLPCESFFSESVRLACLMFRGALPLKTHLSPAIHSLMLIEHSIDLDVLLGFLAATPNLEHLVLLNAVPYPFECASRMLISLPHLTELHSFPLWLFESLLGMAKFFEHLEAPNLTTTRLVLILNLRKYSTTDLYPPSCHALTPFSPITELRLEVFHYTPGRPAPNNVIVHRHRRYETLQHREPHQRRVAPKHQQWQWAQHKLAAQTQPRGPSPPLCAFNSNDMMVPCRPCLPLFLWCPLWPTSALRWAVSQRQQRCLKPTFAHALCQGFSQRQPRITQVLLRWRQWHVKPMPRE
jgi:hypothetical protein